MPYNRPKVVKRIYTGRFSNVYRIDIPPRQAWYVKRFIYPDEFTLDGYDLKAIYGRDRLRASLLGHSFFYKNKGLRRYLPLTTEAIKDLNLLFNLSQQTKIDNLFESIERSGEQTAWIDKVNELTQSLTKMETKTDKVPEYLNNSKVWELKKQLQIISPLNYLGIGKKTLRLVVNLGKPEHIAHGDLQPKNIIIDSVGVEIIDFEETFVAPQDWDIGFLWGNLLYQTGRHRIQFEEVVKLWFKLANRGNNFITISVAVCLMRILMFPLFKLGVKEKKQLIDFCDYQISKL